MAISPSSTVSSDLYSPSEPEQLNPHYNGDSIPIEEPHLSSMDEHDEREGSMFSDAIQGLDTTPDQNSRPSSAAGGTPLALSLGISNKRKRAKYVQNEIGEEDWMTSGRQEGQSFIPQAKEFGSMSGVSSTRQDSEETLDAPLKVKRSKPNGRTLVPSEEAVSLPAVLWQHIFCFVPPVSLGRLLRVNRTFQSYLTSNVVREDMAPLTHSRVQPMNAEAIWVASKRRFAPGLPRPIHGLRELDMWKLLVGQSCQVCAHVSRADPQVLPESRWEAGPGDSGVRIIWPFGIRSCGSCLQEVSQKDFELHISTYPSFLIPALPFAFVSSGNHYIGHNLLKTESAPTGLQMTKRFYKPSLETTMRKFEDAKALGAASAEEWIKGLTIQGQERLEDIIRWEQWESKGGLRKMKSRHPKPIYSGPVHVCKKIPIVRDESRSDRSTPQSTGSSIRHDAGYVAASANLPKRPAHLTEPNSGTTPSQSSWNSIVPLAGLTHQDTQAPAHHLRPERNIRDVNEAKAFRRAEIERRCAALDPPLTPNVLSHMESFQAAMQITQPMTEQAWQILKPRLLAQLPMAERKEKDRIQQDELIVEGYRQQRQQETQLKETKETCDREWETCQNPVRNRLGALADEVIESRWQGGRSVTKDISPKFAADVLLQVRQRFYAEIAREDEAAAAAGEPIKTDLIHGPPTRKLILENMKWLFDTKIKPLTDHFQRELFLCNGCDGNFKFYGFEGVIQHYAAKHTTTLSMGNIVVHWRAEWPEHPPFNPNPSVSKAAYYKVPTPAISAQSPAVNGQPGPISSGAYSQTSEPDPSLYSQRQESFDQPANTFAPQYAGSNQERHSNPISGQSYPPQISNSRVASYSEAPSGYSNQTTNYNSYLPPQSGPVPQTHGSTYSAQHSFAAFGQGLPTSNSQPYFPGPSVHNYGNGQPVPYQSNFQNGSLTANAPSAPGLVSDLYQRQMDEMARLAKDVFVGIGGVKDLPGSVRIYVVIQLTVARFKSTFPNEPSLSMFIDGLDHNATMRPVRSVNGLGCKTCMQSGTGAKLFTLPHLVNHFRTVHVESPQMLGYSQAPELDWKTDMIDLPNASIISKLVNAAGMTDSKLSLIASVFPGCFPHPLPSLKGKTNTGPLPALRRELDIANKSLLGPSHFEIPLKDQINGQPYNLPQSASHNTSSEPPEPVGEDEYDPHRPALLSKTVKAESYPSQSYNPATPSMAQGGARSADQVHSESLQQGFQADHDTYQSYDITNTPRSRIHDDFALRALEPVEHRINATSPKSGFVPRSGARFVEHDGEHSMAQHQRVHELTEYEASADYNDGNRRSFEQNGTSDKSRPENRELKSVSPPETAHAADQFLSSLASGSDPDHSRVPRPPSDRIDVRTKAMWQELPRVAHQKEYHGGDGALDPWQGARPGSARQGHDVAMHHTCVGASGLQNGIQKGRFQRSGSRAPYHEEYYPSPLTQIPPRSVRHEQVTIARPYSQHGVIHDSQGTNGNVSVRPSSPHQVYQGLRGPQYGHRSRSPQETAADMGLYQPRSPVEEDRGDARYPARSQISRRQKDNIGEVVSYDIPEQVRYEYADDRHLQEAPYEPRVEYVRIPLGYDDSRMRELPPRYIVSRPVEQLEPQYVRYEQAYGSDRVEPIYERNGQLYHPPQRAFQEQATRVAPPFTQDYQY